MEGQAQGSTATGVSDPRISQVIMILTYATGGVGMAIGYSTINDSPPSLSLCVLLAVGASGVLSFLRHSVFHRSDAVRMKWDMGRRNNFQIETGIANLAFGLLAIFAVALDWGIAAEAASLLVFGFYLDVVALMLIVSPGENRRSLPLVGVMAAYGIAMTVLGFMGMAA
jgi:hypothetical protein